MALTITLQPEHEAHFREEAHRSGLPIEQLITQRALEAELLWNIRSAAPESETRILHQLLKKQNKRTLTESEQLYLQRILDERELRGAQRLQDLIQLARLRDVSVSTLMNQLGIQPISAP